MANVLQDYFDRLTAVNRQRGMTGNMQYGQKMDASLAEGYFDSYQKNKKDSQDLALRQQALDDNRVYQQGTLANQTRSIDATSLAQQNQTEMYKQALGNKQTWDTVSAIGQLGALGGGAYFRNREANRLEGLNTPKEAPVVNFEGTPVPALGWAGTGETQYNFEGMPDKSGFNPPSFELPKGDLYNKQITPWYGSESPDMKPFSWMKDLYLQPYEGNYGTGDFNLGGS